MSDDISIATEQRTKLGTTAARLLRRDGRIPANVIGHGEAPQAVSISGDVFRKVIASGHKVVDLDVEGKQQKALVRDVQWDTFSRHVQHVDFMRIDATEVMEVEVPVILRGTSPGVRNGGVLDQHAHVLTVLANAANLPDAIEVRVLELNIGDAIHVSDLEPPTGATFANDPETLIVQVNAPVEVSDEDLETADGEPGATQPEVIGQKDDDEGDGEAAAG